LVDIVYLDSIEIYTWQKPTVDNSHQLIFGLADPVLSSNFIKLTKGDWLLDITSPLSPTVVKNETQVDSSAHLFLAAKPAAIPKINSLQPITFNQKDVPMAHQKADYLVIGPQDLLTPLEPILEKRRSEGLTVETQDVFPIYNRYGGYPEAQAIRHYLQEVSAINPKLKYVLMVGDYTYDPKGWTNETTKNRLPTFFIHTLYGGQTSSELPFGVLTPANLDFLAKSDRYDINLAVGRLPAENRQQVDNWVKKMLVYEEREPSQTATKVVAVADPQGDMFAADAQSFLELWNVGVQKELFTPPAGTTDAANTISGYFQSGTTIMAYFGHGSIEMWGKDQLFNSTEAAKLSNSPAFPLVIQMTCLSGYYIHPKIESISEELLWNPNGGTVILIAPSSLTLPNDQGFLTKSFVEHYQKAKHDRIGDIWMQTIREINLNSQGVRDVLATYTLLGDPTLIIK
ncbi:MAG: C25 family cysteine peptidase, partial [Anaerolineales bacterium]